MDTNQKAFAELTSVFMERMTAFEGELKKATPATSITALATDFLSFKNFILKTLTSLQSQMVLVSRSLDNMEMRSRRKILHLHGVPEAKKEDTTDLVKNILCEKLKITDIKMDDISRCHRMGKGTPTKPRPILFELTEVAVRTRVWAAKTQLKGSGVTLSEFLTKFRHGLFLSARQKFGTSKCWTSNGVVFVLSPDGTRHRISRAEDLVNITASENSGVSAAPNPIEHLKSRRPKK